MCKTNKTKFLAVWIKVSILGSQILSLVIFVSAQVLLVLTLGLWTRA